MRNLPISGEYPPDWDQIGDRVRAEAGNRCIRCGHPFQVWAHGKGQWSPCDEKCTHAGPLAFLDAEGKANPYTRLKGTAGELVIECDKHGSDRPVAEWRILTVHHFDGNKSNCAWWNLLSLCQRCHLTIQSRVNPDQPYWFEHSEWLKPYVGGFYAFKYDGKQLTRAEVMERLDDLLKYERIA